MKKRSEDCKRWRERHPEYFQTAKYKLLKLHRGLQYKYGIGLEGKQMLFEKQEGRCIICRLELPPVTSDGCCVDHDHVTDKVRGLLHKGCNVWIGFIERHGKEVLDRAKIYL